MIGGVAREGQRGADCTPDGKIGWEIGKISSKIRKNKKEEKSKRRKSILKEMKFASVY